MSNVWKGVGAWAAEAERAEAEERELAATGANSQVTAGGDSQSFPSLKEAVSSKPKKKEKKMTLSEFTTVTIGVIRNRRGPKVEVSLTRLCDCKLRFSKTGSGLRKFRGTESIRAAINGDNGAPEAPKSTRRGRKKGTSVSTSATVPTRKRSRTKKEVVDNGAAAEAKGAKEEAKNETAILTEEEEEDAYDDGVDSHDYPPLICCFGAAEKEFVPTVRVSEQRMH